ncbi:hypothetical protein SPRG_09076 [Saprolegnia parasitica CBS 223.65]|uniref:Uncharacterized protein n=1 Tax=Saprolegnia parasitica (strain CBS 223.65) TaxID=695850 RepID=A0A067C9F1_SAPPC|nr:hypothetical protein SPRG_09076 [Saprolegnia parasitica CBS 223.65]KDO25780.1 hypothetical protein SPRG_09076 [Saprolegnia parasitica CBS 223.65]|eukprot:XP_012203584.1 hypothetical protein SPRG_09076 [Saprolegnia parasitica CBS 223.65]
MDEREATEVNHDDTDATQSVLAPHSQRSDGIENDKLEAGRKPHGLAAFPDSNNNTDAMDRPDERQANRATLDRVPHGVSQDGAWPARWTSCWRTFDDLSVTVAYLHAWCNTVVTCEARPFTEHAFARAFPDTIFRAGTPERGALLCSHEGCDYRIGFAFNYYLALYMVLPSMTRLRHSHDIVSAPAPASLLAPLDHDALYAAGVGARLWPAPWPTQWPTFSELQHFVAWVQTAFETSLANDGRCFTQAAFAARFPGEPWNDRRVHRGFYYCNAQHDCPFRIYYAYHATSSMYTVITTSSRLAHSHATRGGAIDATLAVVPKTTTTTTTAKPKIGIVAPDDEDSEQADRRKTLEGHFQVICKKAMGNTLFYEYAQLVLTNLTSPHDSHVDADDDDDGTVEAHQPTQREGPRPHLML